MNVFISYFLATFPKKTTPPDLINAYLRCNMGVITVHTDVITVQYGRYYNVIWALLWCNMDVIIVQYGRYYGAIWTLLQCNINAFAPAM